MNAGLVMLNGIGCWDDVAYAEQHGFTRAGFVDSPLICGDPYVAMAMAATRTTSIKLGTMLAVPGTRNPAVIATAISAIDRLAPGRAFLGVGMGNTGRATFGLPPAKVAQFETFIRSCRGLLAGEEVELTTDGVTRPVRMDHRDADQYVNPSLPVVVAAEGPRTRAVAAHLADGWVTSTQGAHAMRNAADVVGESVARQKEAVADAGRDPEALEVLCAVAVCVLADDEDPLSPRVLERVGPVAMLPFHAYADNPSVGAHFPPFLRDRLDVYEERVLASFGRPRDRAYQMTHRGHLSHLLPGEAEVLTEEIIRATTLTGTADEVAGVISGLEAVGVGSVVLNPPPHLVRESVDEYAQIIAPRLGSAGR